MNYNIKPKPQVFHLRKNHSLQTNIFGIRDKIFNDENLKMRINWINNRIPPTNNKKDIQIYNQVHDFKISARKKVIEVNYQKMDYENTKLLNKIKDISNRAKTPNKPDNSALERNERRRINILSSNEEIRKMKNKTIQIQNVSMYSRLTRLHSPLSKKKMDEEYHKHDKFVNNLKNLRGFSKGVNNKIEKMITPYLPRLSPRRSSGNFYSKDNSLNKSPKGSITSSPKSKFNALGTYNKNHQGYNTSKINISKNKNILSLGNTNLKSHSSYKSPRYA